MYKIIFLEQTLSQKITKQQKIYYFNRILVDSNPEEAKSIFPIFSNYFLKITHSQLIKKTKKCNFRLILVTTTKRKEVISFFLINIFSSLVKKIMVSLLRKYAPNIKKQQYNQKLTKQHTYNVLEEYSGIK
jgi:hypothetical protein